MSIPTARAKLLAVADRLEQGTFGRPGVAMEIRQIIDDHMYRELPVRRAPRAAQDAEDGHRNSSPHPGLRPAAS